MLAVEEHSLCKFHLPKETYVIYFFLEIESRAMNNVSCMFTIIKNYLQINYLFSKFDSIISLFQILRTYISSVVYSFQFGNDLSQLHYAN